MKKVLFLAHRIPFPPNKGDKIRSFNELKFLSTRFKIDLITFADSKKDLQYVPKLKEYCDKVLVLSLNKIMAFFGVFIFFLSGKSLSEGFYYSPKFRHSVNQFILQNKYAFVFCFSSQVAQYVSDKKIQKIMDFCDVDSDKWIQYSLNKIFPLSILYRLEGSRLSRKEKEIAHDFSLSLLSTRRELQLFQKKITNANLKILANGVDSNYFKLNHSEKERALVFVGAMDYYANIDAVIWFIEKVFRRLNQRDNHIKFYIVGSNPSQKIRNFSGEFSNVIVTGYVEDVRPYLAKSKIAVIPLRIARGIQNKVLEAMSMELPVIISQKIYASLQNPVPQNVLIFKDEYHFVDLILSLINDDARIKETGKRLREYVLQYYNWNKIFSDFEHILNTNLNLS